MPTPEEVILVNELDHPIGTLEKLEAHRLGLCHRAFSVFVFRFGAEVELLLQQRAQNKYHSPLLWTNTCCSHPRPHESIKAAGERRLQEEFGLTLALNHAGHFHYIAHFNNGLIENEVDHVLIGFYHEEKMRPDPAEIAAFRWVKLTELKQEIALTPGIFTPWLQEALVLAEKALS